MKSYEYFEFSRFIQVLKKDIQENYKTFLWVAGVITGILLLGYVTGAEDYSATDDDDFNENTFPLLLFLGGYWLSAGIFRDLNTAQGRHLYLGLPASNLEKYFSKLLLSSVGYVVLLLIGYSLLTLTGRLIIQGLHGFMPPAFSPFSAEVWQMIGLYMATHAIFLLGGIFYNQYAFFKTSATVFAAFLAFGLVMVGVAYIVSLGKLETFQFNNATGMDLSPGLKAFAKGPLKTMGQVMLYGVLAPVFWVIGYFRLKEREV